MSDELCEHLEAIDECDACAVHDESMAETVRALEAANARIAELTGALERIGWQGNKVICGTCGRHVPACDADGPNNGPPCRGFIARAAIARPSTGGGVTPDTKKREPGCRCHREEGDSECPVHDAADPGRLDPVEAMLAVECPLGHGEAGAYCYGGNPGIVTSFCVYRIRRAAIPATRVGVDPATVEACARAVEAEQLIENLDNEGDKGYRQAIADASRAVRALSQGTAAGPGGEDSDSGTLPSQHLPAEAEKKPDEPEGWALPEDWDRVSR